MNNIIITERQYNKLFLNEAMDNEFNGKEFNSLKTLKLMYDYCVKHLGEYIGKGSSRAVFQINDRLVLKLALNNKGLAQNNVENDCFFENHYSYIFPKIYTYDDYDRYLVSEYVIPLTTNLFKQAVGIDFKQYCDFLFWVESLYSRSRIYYKNQDSEMIKLIETNEWLNDIYDYMCNYEVPIGDMLRKQHYGLVNRDGNPNVVLMDYGLSRDVANQFYSKR